MDADEKVSMIIILGFLGIAFASSRLIISVLSPVNLSIFGFESPDFSKNAILKLGSQFLFKI